jgi:hypothetical protein
MLSSSPLYACLLSIPSPLYKTKTGNNCMYYRLVP